MTGATFRLLRELAERDLPLAEMIDEPRVEALIESGRDTLTVAAKAIGAAYRAKPDEQGSACPERGRRTTRRYEPTRWTGSHRLISDGSGACR